ncbi:hypothetical protein [Halobacterium salinarum]|uniref:hypothetical protein n=1 Tax=Halobacterium salinarum TaxID=2242 RepID=UPI0025550E1F|nr:hypothetical protein [Halobacterium salinarum]MDL0133559.1 hypothetical protein [Halobacterium salinarum]
MASCSDVSPRTIASDPYQALHDQPRPYNELRAGALSSTRPLRTLATRLKPPASHNGRNTSARTIVYLWGDDRRAIQADVRWLTERVKHDTPKPDKEADS